MTDINIDDFFKDAAKTLTALYGVFPRRHAIFVDDIYQTEEPDDSWAADSSTPRGTDLTPSWSNLTAAT